MSTLSTPKVAARRADRTWPGIAGGDVTIPSSIGYGIAALAALGDAVIAPGILAGLYGG